MAVDRLVVPGIVKNGIVVPRHKATLPEGMHVEIVISPAELTPELLAEIERWERAGDEAWALIDQWEKEDH